MIHAQKTNAIFMTFQHVHDSYRLASDGQLTSYSTNHSKLINLQTYRACLQRQEFS